jgi:hypothetical protein
MSEAMIATAVAFLVGMTWGFRKPAGYCRMSTDERQGFSNRMSSGIINGVVLGAIVFIIAIIVFG